MGTILESLKKFGAEPPQMPPFTSEDLPYLIMAALSSGDTKVLSGMLLALAVKIEELEIELFNLKWGEKED
jgi:hypothetical protein